MIFKTPKWVEDETGRVTCMLRLAALSHNKKGSLSQLSVEAGMSFYHLTRVAAGLSILTPENAMAVERVCGKAVTRADLRPDLWGDL